MRKNYTKVRAYCLHAITLVFMGGATLTLQAQTSKSKANEQILQPKQQMSVPQNEFQRGGLFEGFSADQEILSKRSKNAKHFQNVDGSVTAQIGRAVHYKDALGNWQDINLSIAQGNVGIAGYKFRNETNDIKSYFPESPSQNGVLMKLENGSAFKWWNNPTLTFTQNGQPLKSFVPNAVAGVAHNNKLIYPNVYSGISEEFVVLTEGLENNTIIHSLTSEMGALPSDAALEFSQFVPLANGWKVFAGDQLKTSDFESNNIFIRIPGMENGINFGNIVVFDHNISKEDAMLVNMPAEKLDANQKSRLQQSVYTIAYKVSFVNGGIKITAKLPASWLQASERAFPVVIDPTVTITPTSSVGNFYGPLSHWYGYQRHADLYLQSEIGVYGSITQIEYNSTTAGTAGSKPTKVYMRTTAATTLTGTNAWNSATYTGAGAALCLDANTDQGSTTGWKSLTLTTPFTYNQDNLMIMVSDYWGGGGAVKYYNMSPSITARQASNRVDNTDPGDGAATTVENYLPEIRITYNSLTNCSGLPTFGAATSTVSSVCLGSSFILNLSSTPVTSGISYQWQSSTNGGTSWTNLGAAQSSASYTVNGQTQNTSYRVLVTCVPSSATDSSNVVAVTMGTPSTCYCTPPASNCTLDDEITNVTFAGINNNSGCTSGYGNYLALAPAAITTGLSYPITVTTGDGGNEAVAVWIDYNQNGVFEISEYTYIGNTPGGTVTTNVNIPPTALSGTTRMRVRSYYVASGDPLAIYTTTPNSSCDAISTNFGETEDYSVTITAGVACSGTPNAGAATASASSVCANTPITLGTTGTLGVGLTYQWQSSTNGTDWNSLGASQTTPGYTVSSQSVNTQYRLIFTCTNGGLTDTSSVVTVAQNLITNCYCIPSINFNCTDGDVITNVTFVTINNTTTCGNTTTGYTNYSTTIPAAQVTRGTTVPISVSVGPSGDGWLYESVGVWIDFNQNGLLDSLENEYTSLGTGLNQALTGNIAIPASAVVGSTRMRVVVSASIHPLNAYVCGPLTATENYGEMEDYAITIISPTATVVDSVVVTTQGGVAPTIATPIGSLQLVATVYPSTVAQTVNWSIIPVTGTATISASGLVTAQSAGTVWAKAVSTVDATKSDSLLITINNNVINVTSVVVTTQGGVPATIATTTGTLQLVATVNPNTVAQTVNWSIIPVTGTATISASGLVTAQSAGTVWAKAVSTLDATKFDSLLITINNAVINVTSVEVTTLGSIPATIATPSGTLALVATVNPSTVAQTVTWSIIPVTGTATISATGIVTATGNGTVWGKAVSTVDGTKSDSILITITLQDMGINDAFTAVDFNLFPNPTSDVVTLTTGKNHGTLQLQLMDVTGKVLLSRAIQTNELNSGIVVDLNVFSSGMYFIKLQGKDMNISKTVIRK